MYRIDKKTELIGNKLIKMIKLIKMMKAIVAGHLQLRNIYRTAHYLYGIALTVRPSLSMVEFLELKEEEAAHPVGKKARM